MKPKFHLVVDMILASVSVTFIYLYYAKGQQSFEDLKNIKLDTQATPVAEETIVQRTPAQTSGFLTDQKFANDSPTQDKANQMIAEARKANEGRNSFDHKNLRARRQVERVFGSVIQGLNIPAEKAVLIKEILSEENQQASDTVAVARSKGVPKEKMAELVDQLSRDADLQLRAALSPEQYKYISEARHNAIALAEISDTYAVDMSYAGAPIDLDQRIQLAQLMTLARREKLSNESVIASARKFLNQNQAATFSLSWNSRLQGTLKIRSFKNR
jgi:hypothetical protein